MQLTKKKIKKKEKKRKKLRYYVAHKQFDDNFIETVYLKGIVLLKYSFSSSPFSSNLNLEFRKKI
jgi:hypothetical protein